MKYMIAKAGKPKEVLEKWRDDFFAGQDNVRAYMRTIGATQSFGMRFEKPRTFKFEDGGQPQGWMKPTRDGRTWSKKRNLEAQQVLDAILFAKPLDAVMQEEFNLAIMLRYKVERDGKNIVDATRYLSNSLRAFTPCWTVDADNNPLDMMISCLDYAKAEADVRQMYTDAEITWGPDGATTDLPDGFEMITEAQVDLIFAQSKVDREEAEAASPAEDLPMP